MPKTPLEPLAPTHTGTGPGTAPHSPAPDEPATDRVAAQLADHRLLTEMQNRGDLEPYAGEYVAALNKALVGHGPNAAALLDEVSAKFGVPKARIAVLFVY